MEPRDILLDPGEDKEKTYERVHALYLQGKSVTVQEDESGFPAVTVDCEDIHILTDIISLERWWAREKEQHERSDS